MRIYISKFLLLACVFWGSANASKNTENACPAFTSNCPCVPEARAENRYVNGFHDTIINVPYVVSIQWNDFHYAVGTLVDETTVVTSAHAVKNVLPEDLPLYSIRAGSSNSRIGGQVVNIAAVYRYPTYEAYPPKNDIAVIKLEAPVVFGDVKPAILPKRDFEIKHVSLSCKVFVWVTFSGWGALNYVDQPCDSLQTSFVPLIDDTICEDKYEKSFDDKIYFCLAEEARANCQGDSGSGLLLDNMLVGITTFQAECPNKKTPAKYLKITAYLDFIEHYMEKH